MELIQNMLVPEPSVWRQVIAEAVGTFLLIFFGCGVVHAAVLTGAQQGLWQVAIVWGISIMLAIYAIGAVSGAHINPAMTLAFAAWRGFPKNRVIPFIAAQFVGSVIAAAALYFLFGPLLSAKEAEKGVVRGAAGSEVTAMCYGEYYPNPNMWSAGPDFISLEERENVRRLVPHHVAFAAELLGTLILSFIVFAVTDGRNPGRPLNGQAPIFIGLTIAALISVIAPLTQACFNPARDLGPRCFAAVAGWGSIALPGFQDFGWLTVYIIAPFAGAMIGGGLYELLIRPSFPLTRIEAKP
jgi:glycerol uptake facilitator protein